MSENMRNGFKVALTIGLSLVIMAVLALIIVWAATQPSRAEQCTRNGGSVSVEREYKRGKWYKEYECNKDGREIDEWKVRA